MRIKIKRVYEAPSPQDGYRVLVDRLWPRGLKKEEAAVDLWVKHLAPSETLRKWFSHEQAKWPDFQSRYRQELKRNKPQLEEMLKACSGKTLTLLYAAKDADHNNAVVLKDFIESTV